MSKRLDLTGQRFGKLTATKFVSLNESQNALWHCVCDCGNQKLAQASQLRAGLIKSCGCKQKPRYKDKSLALKKESYSTFCSRAKKKSIEVISFEKYVNLISQPCFYCGSVGSNTLRRSRFFVDLKCNGIDRIDSNIGYIESNVVSCCKYCNSAKNNMTVQEFQDWIQRVYSHYIKPSEQMDYNI